MASIAAPYSWMIRFSSAVPGAGSASLVRLSSSMYFMIRFLLWDANASGLLPNIERPPPGWTLARAQRT